VHGRQVFALAGGFPLFIVDFMVIGQF